MSKVKRKLSKFTNESEKFKFRLFDFFFLTLEFNIFLLMYMKCSCLEAFDKYKLKMRRVITFLAYNLFSTIKK